MENLDRDEWGAYDPTEQYVENYLDFLDEVQRDLARAAEHRLRLVDDMRRAWEAERGGSIFTDTRHIQSRALRAEVAAALCMPEQSAEALLAFARTAVHSLPATMEQLRAGNISERHAKVLADEVAGLSDEHTAELERRALPHARLLTPGKFERKVRMLREMLEPSDMTERHRDAMLDREVSVTAGRHGMGDFYARADLGDLLAIDNYLDAIVDSLAVAEGETRTRAQLRADVFVDLLLDQHALVPPRDGDSELREPSRPRGIVPTVHVTVPALTLAGIDDTPASLEGQHPIDPETARQLVGASSGFHRILTQPETGAVLSFGRDKYRVPPELRRYLVERDATCRFVGCSRPARACDVDHTKDWQWDGTTDCGNLAHACQSHHTLKHEGGWKVEQDPDRSGTLTWRSPSGRQYRTEPSSPPATLFRDQPPGSMLSTLRSRSLLAQTDWTPLPETDGLAPF